MSSYQNDAYDASESIAHFLELRNASDEQPLLDRTDMGYAIPRTVMPLPDESTDIEADVLMYTSRVLAAQGIMVEHIKNQWDVDIQPYMDEHLDFVKNQLVGSTLSYDEIINPHGNRVSGLRQFVEDQVSPMLRADFDALPLNLKDTNRYDSISSNLNIFRSTNTALLETVTRYLGVNTNMTFDHTMYKLESAYQGLEYLKTFGDEVRIVSIVDVPMVEVTPSTNLIRQIHMLKYILETAESLAAIPLATCVKYTDAEVIKLVKDRSAMKKGGYRKLGEFESRHELRRSQRALQYGFVIANSAQGMKIGKAYRTVFGALLSDAMLEDLVNRHRNSNPFVSRSSMHMHIARTPDEMEYAFAMVQGKSENMTTTSMLKQAAVSCMRQAVNPVLEKIASVRKQVNRDMYELEDIVREGTVHPSAVYANEDFYCVYVTNSKTPMDISKGVYLYARSVVGIQNPRSGFHPLNWEQGVTPLLKDSINIQNSINGDKRYESWSKIVAHVAAPIYSSNVMAANVLTDGLEKHVAALNGNDSKMDHVIYTGLERQSMVTESSEWAPYPWTWEGLRLNNIMSEKAHTTFTINANSNVTFRITEDYEPISLSETALRGVSIDSKLIGPYLDTTASRVIVITSKLNDNQSQLLIMNEQFMDCFGGNLEVARKFDPDLRGDSAYNLDRLSKVLPNISKDVLVEKLKLDLDVINMRAAHRGAHAVTISSHMERECRFCGKPLLRGHGIIGPMIIDGVPDQFTGTCGTAECDVTNRKLFTDDLHTAVGYHISRNTSGIEGKISAAEFQPIVTEDESTMVNLAIYNGTSETATTLQTLNEFESRSDAADIIKSIYGVFVEKVKFEKSQHSHSYGFSENMIAIEGVGFVTNNEAKTHYGFSMCSMLDVIDVQKQCGLPNMLSPEKTISVTIFDHFKSNDGYVKGKTVVKSEWLSRIKLNTSREFVRSSLNTDDDGSKFIFYSSNLRQWVISFDDWLKFKG